MNGFTSAHLEALIPLKDLKEVIFFFDGDEAGRNGQETIAKMLKNIKTTFVETPENEDINSLLQSHEPEILTHLLAQRKAFSFSTENQSPHNPVNQVNHTFDSSQPDLLIYQSGGLKMSILGGIKLTGLDKLRVTLKIESQEARIPIRQNLDLYSLTPKSRP